MNDEETDRLVRVGLMMATLISETLERADDKLVAANAKSAALMIQLDAASGDTVSDACFKSAVAERDEARASLVAMKDRIKRIRRSHEGALTERNEAHEESAKMQAAIEDARLASGAANSETLVEAVRRIAGGTIDAALWATLGSPKAPVTLVAAARKLVMERDANVAQNVHVRCLVGARDGETTATAVRRALDAYRKSAGDGDLAGPTTRRYDCRGAPDLEPDESPGR